MPRRYRIEHWLADRRTLLEILECTAAEFEAANWPDDNEDWDGTRALTLGQYITLGGGAAPITVITCVEE